MSSSLNRLFTSSLSTLVKERTLKAMSNDLFKERNLKVLVEKFKKSSECYRFRTKTGIYVDTVRRLASAKKFQYIEEILEEQKKYSDISKEGFAVRLISLYGKSGMFDHASKVFDEMPEMKCERTVKSFNALLGACVGSKKFDKVPEFFRELPEKLSVKPDLVSYNTVIKAFCEMGSLDSALSMVEEMEKNGVEPDVITFNTLLDAFYGKNKFLEGERIFARMQEKNIVPVNRTYNARFVGLVNEKKISEAISLVEELESKGLKPDVFSYNALMKGYCNEGDKEGAKKWYSELVKSDHVPDKSTYSTLIPFACEKSDYDWAFDLCNELFNNKCRFNAALLQPVVDGLVKESKNTKAKKLVELGKSNNYCRCNLEMSTEV